VITCGSSASGLAWWLKRSPRQICALAPYVNTRLSYLLSTTCQSMERKFWLTEWLFSRNVVLLRLTAAVALLIVILAKNAHDCELAHSF
jgi:hypothetical protein